RGRADAARRSRSLRGLPQEPFELAVHAVAREPGDRRGRGAGEPVAERRVVDEPPERGGERIGRAGRHEQAVDAVVNDLGHAADARRDDGRPDRERLDRGVRQVLPVARQDGGPRAAERVEHRLARLRAAERDAPVQAGVVRAAFERSALGPVADHDEPRVRNPRDGVDRNADRLLARQAAGVDERVRLGRDGGRGHVGRRVRDDEHARRIGHEPASDAGEVLARDDDRARPTEGQRPRPAERNEVRRRGALEALERAVEEAVPVCALVGGVGHELRDERRARRRRRGGRGRVRRRGVDHVGAACAHRAARGEQRVAHGKRVPARDGLDRAGSLGRLRVGHRHDAGRVPACHEKPREVGAVGRRTADVGRPDTGKQEDVHAVRAGPPWCGPRSRRAYHRRVSMARFRHEEPRLPGREVPFLVLCVALGLSLVRSINQPELTVHVLRNSITFVPADLALAALAVLCAGRLLERRTLPRPARAITATGAGFAAWLLLSSAVSGGSAFIGAAKLTEYGLVALGVILFVNRRPQLCLLYAVLVLVNTIGVGRALYDFAHHPGSRQGAFLGEHDLAALSTMTLAGALVILYAPRSRGRFFAFAGLIGAIGITLGAALAQLVGLYLAVAALLALAYVRRTVTVRALVVTLVVTGAITAGTLSLRSGELGFLQSWFGSKKAEAPGQYAGS